MEEKTLVSKRAIRTVTFSNLEFTNGKFLQRDSIGLSFSRNHIFKAEDRFANTENSRYMLYFETGDFNPITHTIRYKDIIM